MRLYFLLFLGVIFLSSCASTPDKDERDANQETRKCKRNVEQDNRKEDRLDGEVEIGDEEERAEEEKEEEEECTEEEITISETPVATQQSTEITPVPTGDNINTPEPLTLSIYFFDTASPLLLDDSVQLLNEQGTALLGQIIKYPSTMITITGHADTRGQDAVNQELSLERAYTVARYLRVKGIPKEKLIISGRGSSSPINTNNDQTALSQNRRVEVTFQVE